MSVIKESCYDKVLINAANKNILQKNEMEYSGALHLKTPQGCKKVEIVHDLKRKVNILTLKDRPKCASSGCIVGFKWYQNDSLTLSESAFLAGNYPKGSKFEAKSIAPEIWDQLERDLSEDNQIMA
jgi:hypothetical protein